MVDDVTALLVSLGLGQHIIQETFVLAQDLLYGSKCVDEAATDLLAHGIRQSYTGQTVREWVEEVTKRQHGTPRRWGK